MPYILAGTVSSSNNSTNRPLIVDGNSKNSSWKVYRWRHFTRNRKKGSKSSMESISSDSTTTTASTTTTTSTTTTSSSSNTSYYSEPANGGEVCPSPIIQGGDDDGKAGHHEAGHTPLNGSSSSNCTTIAAAAGTGSIPQSTNIALLQGNSDYPLANSDASPSSSVAASQSPSRPTSHYYPSNNHPCYIEEEEGPVTEEDCNTSTVQSLFQLLLPPSSIHDFHPSSSLSTTANSDQVTPGNNSALSNRPTSIAASETSTLRPRPTSSYDRPTSRPLSSYFRDPLPGDSPPPSLSVSASPLESEDMTSLASNGRPSSTVMPSNSNGNNSVRDTRQSYHQQQQHDNDANVSAQIMNLANMIVSPVPQHRIHVSSGEDHLVSPRSSSSLNGQGQLPGQLQPGHYSYPSQQQDQHLQQWQNGSSSSAAAFPITSMNIDTSTSSRNQPLPGTKSSRHRAKEEEYEDYGDLTLEEMQERALSKANTRNSSMTNFSIYNNGVLDDEAPLPPVPSIPPAFNNSNRPQSSFSIITDNNASASDGNHIAATSGSSSKARRREPSSDNSMMNNHQDSPPKPKLRNLDTSVSAARGRVSSFFGGISDSLSGNSNHNTPNTTTASSATPSSTSYPSAMAPREGSPLPSEGMNNHHVPSSSYPTTSHMQPPPASSVPQSRSHSQPLQHQQTIPQYAIPPPPTLSQSQAQAQYAHHQQQASSSTSTHLHPASRSSFYGLDQGQGGGDHEGQQQRWRSERRASPSTIASSSAGGSRPASQSVPRSDTGHYASPSLGASSSSNYGGQGGAYYSGSNEAGAPGGGGNSRKRVTSWTTRSNASSVYGLNMASPQLVPSNSGDLLPLPSVPGGSNVPPVPHLTQAHLRPGQGVSLLSHQKTLDMYRANVKKTNDPEVTFELAQFMLGLAKEMAIQEMNANANAQQYFSNGGFALNGVSEENLLSSLNRGINDTAAGDSTSPSPDPSFSFHSRSSGSSGDLQSAAIAANRTFSSQGLNHNQGGLASMNAAGLQRRRGSHSPAGSISTAARLSAVGMNRTGSPTAAHGGANAANGSTNNDRRALVAEALSLLKRSADRGHVASQYFLADIYANGGLETNKSGVSRASIYALLPGSGSHSHNNGTGSGNVSPLEMKMHPSPTGSSASLGQANSGFVNASSAPAVTSIHQKPDFDKALPLFIAAAKHGHIPSCYRAGECFENGWGCRKDATKAVQFYRKSAASSFPEAMYRLGMAELNGELGLKDRQKDGFKWLKQVAALAESNNENSSNNGGSVQMNGGNSQDGLNGFSSSPSGVFGLDDPSDINGSGNNNNQGTRLCTVQALHELALLHERGIHNVVFVDNEYAAELLARASELGYAPSAYKLGECYEYGRMGCPQDAALSIHYYNIAAQQNHREACFALTAWYLVGSPGVLPQSDTEAYLWAKKAAEQGLAKAEYAVGYFTEVGIGTIKDEREAVQWFTKAAEHGDKRAITRLRTLGVNTEAIVSPPMSPRSARMSVGPNSTTGHGSSGGGKKKGSRASNAHNSSASREQTPNSAEMVEGVGAGGSSNGAPPAKEKRRSRRSTIPGIMGMSNKEDVPPVPGTSGGGKKSDTDCIIS